MNMLIKVALLICFISATQCTNSSHTISKRQVASSVCSTNTCRYGECEIVSSLSFRCHCNVGITGDFCNTRATNANDPCGSNPCWNGAVCNNLSATTFRCTCPAGFEGPQCRALTGASCQCLNGGQCIPVSGSNGLIAYRCNCPAAFGGNRCEFIRSAFASCQSVGCQNNGYCTIFSTCVCQPGFTGQFCQTSTVVTVNPIFVTVTPAPVTPSPFALNVCAPGICLNGGTCFQITNSLALCSCPVGFSGVFCNIGGTVVNPVNPTFPLTSLAPVVNPIVNPVVNFCTNNPCQNGGACTPTTGTLGRCICPAAFTGVLCETGYTCTNFVCPVGQQCVVTNNLPACQIIVG